MACSPLQLWLPGCGLGLQLQLLGEHRGVREEPQLDAPKVPLCLRHLRRQLGHHCGGSALNMAVFLCCGFTWRVSITKDHEPSPKR